MATYKQIVKLDWHDVQSLCVKHGWYTKGTCREYGYLQDEVRILDLFDGDDWVWNLEQIAKNIKAHSDTEYEVADIMTALNMKCRRWFIAA